MPLDSHRFDTWLKEKLGRELAFRLLLWTIISTVSAVMTILKGSHPTIPFSRFMDTAWPLMLMLTRPVMCICGLALMFKDLEQLDPHKWGQATVVGKIGGVFRRLAGDGILWFIGLLIAGWVTMIIALLADDSRDEGSDAWKVGVALSGMVLIMIAFGVIVRRERPSPWVDVVSSAKVLVTIYVSSIVIYLSVF